MTWYWVLLTFDMRWSDGLSGCVRLFQHVVKIVDLFKQRWRHQQVHPVLFLTSRRLELRTAGHWPTVGLLGSCRQITDENIGRVCLVARVSAHQRRLLLLLREVFTQRCVFLNLHLFRKFGKFRSMTLLFPCFQFSCQSCFGPENKQTWWSCYNQNPWQPRYLLSFHQVISVFRSQINIPNGSFGSTEYTQDI